MDLFSGNLTTRQRLIWLIRWGLGLWLIWWGWQGLVAAYDKQGLFSPFAAMLFSFAKCITGALLLAPELAVAAARPFIRWIDAIYLPGGHASKPPLDYKLADHYRKNGETDRAIDRYRAIARFYPGEAKAHGWLVAMLTDEPGGKRAAKRAYATAKRQLKKRGPEAWKRFRRIVKEHRDGEG